MYKDNNKQDKEEERKIKQLNQEIMFIFEKHAAPVWTCLSIIN
jgi:hypothetical protein